MVRRGAKLSSGENEGKSFRLSFSLDDSPPPWTDKVPLLARKMYAGQEQASHKSLFRLAPAMGISWALRPLVAVQQVRSFFYSFGSPHTNTDKIDGIRIYSTRQLPEICRNQEDNIML